MGQFQGKVAIITGASSGMGKAVAMKLAEVGAKITLVDINEEGTNETILAIEEKGGSAIFVKANVSSAWDVHNYVAKTIEKFGKVDLFFNNAGIVGKTAKIEDLTIEQIESIIDVNLKGAIYGMKYVITEMVKTGGGSIVSTASASGVEGTNSLSAYSASKHGVIGLTKSTALEYANQNIRINAIAPGVIDTPMLRGMDPEVVKHLETTIPMNRLGNLDEIANLVIYLFGDNSTFITGTVISIDGGATA